MVYYGQIKGEKPMANILAYFELVFACLVFYLYY